MTKTHRIGFWLMLALIAFVCTYGPSLDRDVFTETLRAITIVCGMAVSFILLLTD